MDGIRQWYFVADACVSFVDNCMIGIKPNHEKIKKNLNNSLMHRINFALQGIPRFN